MEEKLKNKPLKEMKILPPRKGNSGFVGQPDSACDWAPPGATSQCPLVSKTMHEK